MKKRNVFDELVQGFDDLQVEREGKITLKSTTVEAPQPIAISAGQIRALRERLNYSQGVFAALLRTNVSTLRNWEQDRAKPNAQAALLLKLVESAPKDMLGKLSALGKKKPRTASKAAPAKCRVRRDAPAKKAAKKRAVG